MKPPHYIATSERPLLVGAIKKLLPKLEGASLTEADEHFRRHPEKDVRQAYASFVRTAEEVNQSRDSSRFTDDLKTSLARGAVKRVAHQSALLYLLSFIRTHGYNAKTRRIEKNL